MKGQEWLEIVVHATSCP